MQAYGQALLSFGDYAGYMTEDVTLTQMDTNQVTTGWESVQ